MLKYVTPSQENPQTPRARSLKPHKTLHKMPGSLHLRSLKKVSLRNSQTAQHQPIKENTQTHTHMPCVLNHTKEVHRSVAPAPVDHPKPECTGFVSVGGYGGWKNLEELELPGFRI